MKSMNVKTLYIICAVLVVLVILSMVFGCPTKSDEGFQSKSKKKKNSFSNLSKEEMEVVNMLEENYSDNEIKEYMTKNINKFKNKETFANIMDALADSQEELLEDGTHDEEPKPVKKSSSKRT